MTTKQRNWDEFDENNQQSYPNNPQRMERERDLILPPTEFAYIQDKSKGVVTVHVGPVKQSLSETDVPVLFDGKTKRFRAVTLEQAKQQVIVAPESWYITLKNPATKGSYPEMGRKEDIPDLNIGNKVNIPGPFSFALWPGQMAEVVKGHHLRNNEFQICRCYNEKVASSEIKDAVVVTTDDSEETKKTSKKKANIFPDVIKTGDLFIIKGTQVRFFMPPSGVEVVRDESGRYIRDAITLETLEYCILKDENGSKRIVEGPDVVFPEPTEVFMTNEEGEKKFRALDLNKNSGIYVSVIEDYTDEKGQKHKKGDELFLTGEKYPIYYPRKEHAIFKYGSKGEQHKVHHAIAIPEGDARYVMLREGVDLEAVKDDEEARLIRLVKGPQMYLPNPIHDLVVRRVLNMKQVQLYYPGNQEAIMHNVELQEMAADKGYVAEEAYVAKKGSSKRSLRGDYLSGSKTMSFDASRGIAPAAKSAGYFGDGIDRKEHYTPPRTITLDNKFDGAVRIQIWNNFAIQIVSTTGKRDVVVGPKTVLLQYDETLDVLTLSKGRPKTQSNVKETVYLKTTDNRVKDRIVATTSDLFDVEIDLAYLVDFVDEPSKWFNSSNYVQYLCDHMRSIIRNKVKKIGVREFYANETDILRDIILGVSIEGKRAGQLFELNNMKLFDAEIFNVRILDAQMEDLLVSTKKRMVQEELLLELQTNELEVLKQKTEIQLATAKEKEKLELEIAKGRELVEVEQDKIRNQVLRRNSEYKLANLSASDVFVKQQLEQEKESEEARKSIASIELAKDKAAEEQILSFQTARQKLEESMISLRSGTKVAESAAIQRELIEAMTALAKTGGMEAILKEGIPLSIVQGQSVAQTISGLFEGSQYQGVLEKLIPGVKKRTTRKTKAIED